jgi:hypothetical protein
MTYATVSQFRLHNGKGQSILDSDLTLWMTQNGKFQVFGPVTLYSWEISGTLIEFDNSAQTASIKILPDATGFICFENTFAPDNCLLLDAWGKERMRLTVPWEMTGYEGVPPDMRTQGKPMPRKMWFRNVSTPHTHPDTGEPGQFGVSANLEYGDGEYDYCDYYFELDWRTGEFLWGRPIRF